MRCVEGGCFMSFATGRIGRGERFPPQFGQTPLSFVSTHARQNVHSYVHIIASVADGGRSLSQHSQPGLNSSIASTTSCDSLLRSIDRIVLWFGRRTDRRRSSRTSGTSSDRCVSADSIDRSESAPSHNERTLRRSR